jgi:hypothetical protein
MKFNSTFFIKYYGYLISTIYIFLLYYFYYETTWDESYQIEAAYRLLINHKYENSWVFPIDLSIPKFTYLTAWPIGYSFLIYIFLFLKVKLQFAIITIKSILIFLNIFLWVKISEKFLTHFISKILSNLLFSLIIIINSRGSTELIVMASVGFITYHYILKNNFGNKIQDYFSIGLVLSLSFLFKYTTILFIFSTFIFLVYNSKKDKIYIRVIKIFAFLIPLSTIIILVFLKNYIESKNISTLTNFNNYNKLEFLFKIDYINVLNVIFFDSIQLPLLLKKGFAEYLNFKTNFNILLIPFFIFIFIYFKKYFTNFSYKTGYIVITFSSTIILLFLISIYFFTDPFNWYPLIESRYYQPISLFLVIIFIKPLDNILNKIKKDSNIISIFIIIVITLFFIFYSYKRFANSFIIKNKIDEVNNSIINTNNLTKNTNYIVFADPNYFYLIPRNGKNNIFYFDSKKINLDAITKSVNVYIFASKFSFQGVGLKLRDKEYKIIEKYSNQNQFNKIQLSNGSYFFYKIY